MFELDRDAFPGKAAPREEEEACTLLPVKYK